MISENVISERFYLKLIMMANVTFCVIWFASNEGLSFWDDFSYLNFANELNQGNFEITENHFTSRITLIYPTAWVIQYLGINQYTIVIYPLICGLILMNIFFWMGHRVNRWIGLIGGLMILCDYHVIYFSNHLFPEMPLMLFIFISLVAYYMVLKGEVVPRLAALLAALALFAAFLTKTTVVLVLPLFLYLFINDRLKKRQGSFWLVFVSLSVFFFLLNGFWYLEVKGDFFYRFQNIANNHVATAKTFFDKDASRILDRLTYLPLLGFLRGGFFIPLLIALPAVVLLKRKDFKLDTPENLWPVSLLFLLAGFWFFSTSWRYYSPLPTETRHIAFFIPVMIMTAATFWPAQKVFLLLKKHLIMLLAVGAFLAIPVYAVLKSDRSNFKAQQRLTDLFLVKDPREQWVITDGLSSYGYPYFYDFGRKAIEDHYLWFSEMNLDELTGPLADGTVYVLRNPVHFNEEYNDSANYDQLLEDLSTRGYKLVMTAMKEEVILYHAVLK